MDKNRRNVVQLNIERYERLLRDANDPATIDIMRELLAEARAEEKLFKEEAALEGAAGGLPDIRDAAHRLRLRAEEYRTVAHNMKSHGARDAYLHLARSYEVLAQRAELRAGSDRTTKTG